MRLYRYDSYGQNYTCLREFEVEKETPCGYWIREDFGGDCQSMQTRWMSKEARRPYARMTKDDALEHFKRRKQRQIEILQGQLQRTIFVLAKANEINVE